jgi:predicted MarR family transcription regulator
MLLLLLLLLLLLSRLLLSLLTNFTYVLVVDFARFLPWRCRCSCLAAAPDASSDGNNLVHKCVVSSSSAEVGRELAAAGPAERGERFWP